MLCKTQHMSNKEKKIQAIINNRMSIESKSWSKMIEDKNKIQISANEGKP